MAVDVIKNLEKAKKFLEKNRVEGAIEAYLSVLHDAPNHPEATQALGDLYARHNQPGRAAVYYGMFFDLLVDPREESKALAIYGRFLRNAPVQQPPERVARYAYLLQRQNRPEEAIEQFTRAAELFTAAGREEDALFCWERTAQLDPDNLGRQLRLGEAAERIGKNAVAARAFLRTAQLASASGAEVDALKLLGRAHGLAPQERGTTLLYAEAKLRAGDAAEAVRLLDPYAATENDAPFLETFSDALIGAGELDRARAILEKLLREKNAGIQKLFDLADACASASRDAQAIEVLQLLKGRMTADRRVNDYTVQVDAVMEKHRDSLALMEFWASLYNELNRETQYFEILLHLFDLNLEAGNIPKSRETLERLVDIDAYDHRNQQRLERLRGRVDDSYLKNLGGRLARGGATTSPPERRTPAAPPAAPPAEAARLQQELEDLIVQTEIFLQYSLQSKALERLQKIAEMHPGEEERNMRLRSLYVLAKWWPPGAKKPETPSAVSPEPVVEAQPVPMPGKTGVYSAETLRDLTKISEITQKIYRQQTPRAMLSTAVNEVGAHLNAARTFAVVGMPGQPPEMAAEYCATGVKPAPGTQVVLLLSELEMAAPDSLGGQILNSPNDKVLEEMGLATALGVILTDKETQSPAGMLIVAHAGPHVWKPNETYFLQAVGDQMLMSVSHTRLRALVRRMGVSGDKSGLLSRSSYQGCLLTEADRAKSQGTPLSLTILQIDRGADIMRQQGEAALDRYVEQVARSLQPMVRQNDVAVKYTAWSLAFILPDTGIQGARILAGKLRRAATNVRVPWDGGNLTISAAIVEAAARQEFDSEDTVTDLINRAEMSLDEAQRQGGNVLVASEIPKA